jgi:2-polyprenyl-3-methyl-5-hydroxy-6-metoxy-1,4-benzoquinol methylase
MPKCTLCDQMDFTLVASRIREGDGKIIQCNHCGLVIQDLDWDWQRLQEYYETEYQCTNSLVAGRVQTPQEHFDDRLRTIGPIFEQVRPLLKPDSRVLEVGCGTGELLWLIKPHVARCVGVEMHTPFVDFITAGLGLEAYASDINHLNLDEQFDVVLSIATLDHLPNPLETLVTLKNLLSPSGRLYVEVPNRSEALNFFLPAANRAKFNEFFWHRAHLFYFTKETIAKLFAKAALQVSIACRHDYTLKNFLNWYFKGEPQSSLIEGCTEVELFMGDDDFELRMNKMFTNMEKEFKKIMAETFRGDNLCCTGWRA